MNNVNGDSQVRNLFFKQYKNLYNRYDKIEIDEVSNYILRRGKECEEGKCKFEHKVTIYNVTEAIESLKPNKNDYF